MLLVEAVPMWLAGMTVQPKACAVRIPQLDVVLNCLTGLYDEAEQRVSYNQRHVM
jgi:hypothetical protein